jgi:hypothetical protein
MVKEVYPRKNSGWHKVWVYCNIWLLQQKDMHHETSVVGIGYGHECLSPQTVIRHSVGACCTKLSPQTKLWRQACATTRKSVATCHIIVAIIRSLATIHFLWQ